LRIAREFLRPALPGLQKEALHNLKKLGDFAVAGRMFG